MIGLFRDDANDTKIDCVFYSYAKSIYDHITQNKYAYTNAVAGIQNLIDEGVDVHIKTFINLRPTYRSIDRTTRAISELFDVDKIFYVGAITNDITKYPNIIIPFKRSAPWFSRALDVAIDIGIEPHIASYPLGLLQMKHQPFVIEA